MKEFNVTGVCIPDLHYMVDLCNKLEYIKSLIDKGLYFTINRARQYGKTTIIYMVDKYLPDAYSTAFLSFEGLGSESFDSVEAFCQTFVEMLNRSLKNESVCNNINSLTELSKYISHICTNQKIILIIDEVDKISNHFIFIDFLGMLRDKYLMRSMGRDTTFYSVILSGVADIKNTKLQMTQKGFYQPHQGERNYNSPWNIAADFDLDMSFCPSEITTMLKAYEHEHKTDMDISQIADDIYRYTNGYPYLVSRICKHIDEKLNKNWSSSGILNAVKIILRESNTLFDDLFKNLEINHDVYNLVYDILIVGRQRAFQIDNPTISIASMYGIIADKDGIAVISNKIFEMRIYNYFISKDEDKDTKKITGVLQSDIVMNGRFQMDMCVKKFAKHYAQTFTDNDIRFLEHNVRQVFLTYLKPLINGQGFYHIESRLLDQRRMDIVVDFNNEQFVIELKIWNGERRHEDAYIQLDGYLDTLGLKIGYLLTFDFRKQDNKTPKSEWVKYNDKQIFDVII